MSTFPDDSTDDLSSKLRRVLDENKRILSEIGASPPLDTSGFLADETPSINGEAPSDIDSLCEDHLDSQIQHGNEENVPLNFSSLRCSKVADSLESLPFIDSNREQSPNV
jgi:hypothetical protein